ncbi:leucine aminopeptidase 2, chloroplastic-like [Rutidosis leptorrhynchoides]|uniref:leucine aminopeptidase 2, chloroplastic-like n=1 Tax=Rutidosis leptorrhynchoides TaxID=125765 RepID=UPI003A993122
MYSLANVLTPGALADEAENFESTYSDVFTAKILDTEQCKELNIDAKGRLTLADALVYACNLGVDMIFDLATLTGACIL